MAIQRADNVTLYDLCVTLKNFFCEPNFYALTIHNNRVDLSTVFKDAQNGDKIIVVGSSHDGVYEFSEGGIDLSVTPVIESGVLSGGFGRMFVPPTVFALLDEINEWCVTNADMRFSPYTSESFGGYSYSKASGSGDNGSWQGAFASRLNRWRKI